MSHGIYETALTLPIPQSALQTAQRFAQHQPTAAKAEQVRLNTLAVLVMRNYFELMDIPTDLGNSDSWDPVMQVCMNVADLELPDIGRLECRPVLPNCDRWLVPAETWEDRVGYVAVQIDEAAQEAQILGFVPKVEDTTVNDDEEAILSDLRSPEALLDHLYDLRSPEPVTDPSPSPIENLVTNLSQWFTAAVADLEQTLSDGWQAVEQVIAPPELSPAYAFRFRRPGENIRRARRLNLGAIAVALVVDLRTGESESELDIRLQLMPTQPEARLPQGLTMAVHEPSGEVVIDAEATGAEDFLELQISGVPGEAFTVIVQFDTLQVSQDFEI